MLIQFHADGNKIQAFLGEEHPDCSVFGYMVCPVCGKHLHGHGWRQRFAQDPENTYRVWIHRKLCPGCGTSFTLLPSILHALKLYTLRTIIQVLSYRVAENHFTSRIRVPVKLQRVWFLLYHKRLRILTDFPEKSQANYSPVCCAPLVLSELRDSANIQYWIHNRSPSHHRLGFYLPFSQT